MTIAARTRLLLLAVLCAALALSLSATPVTAASTPTATAAKKKRGHKRRATKRDLDGDGIPNTRDRDIDGDGKPNSRDRDIDGDGRPNSRDRDIDGDGKPNVRDRDMDGDRVPNARDRDMDADGTLNIRDNDPDGDGKPGIASGVLPPPPPPVKQARTFFGVVGGAHHSAEIAATGAGAVRLIFSWAGAEPTPGNFDFSAIDGQVTASAEQGLTVLPLLFEAPSFRSSAPAQGAERGWYPPSSNADFAAFAAAAARRYGPGGSFWQRHPELPQRPIRAWQVWNEPNLPVYWRPAPNAAHYVEMLRAVGTAIEGVDPDAEIVTAGVPDSGTGVPLADYLAGMYRAGGKGAFDTLASHPYATTPEGVGENLAIVRALLDRHGDHGANLRATEFGWATSGPAGAFTVGEQAQATLIRRTLERLTGEASRLRLRGVAYYNLADEPLAGSFRDFWGLHAGLLDTSGRRKPGFHAFADAARALAVE
ncbi:MAG: hypothetical protein M3N16_05435 [Actinomycetota bacterium]|nr:hypothetical protein [Actinomycetota bacterium]